MITSLLDTLNSLLLPMAVALVLVILVYLLATGSRPSRRTPRRPPAAGATAPAAPDTLAPAAQPDADLDLAPPPPPVRARPATPAPPLTADLLLVDDSAVVRTMLKRLFTAAGYTVALAPDGVEALARLRDGHYALMVTDLEMPKLDGIGLIAAVNADPALRGLPILAITGHENLQERLGACEGVIGIHRKPWNDEDLRDNVAAVVAARRALAVDAEE